MGGPSRMCNTGVSDKRLFHIAFLLRDEFSECCDLADLLVDEDFIFCVAVDSETCVCVSTLGTNLNWRRSR